MLYDFLSDQFIIHVSIVVFVSVYAGTRNEGGSVAIGFQGVISRWYV